MPFTNLYQLDSGDYPVAHYIDLNAETLAKLTDHDKTRLQGFFGSGSVGIAELYYEEHMSWADVAECMEGTHEAIIPIQYREKFNVPPKVDETDLAINKILDAMTTLKSNHYLRDWDFRDEDSKWFRTLDRYANMFGYRCIATSMSGTSPGDQLNILHIIPINKDPKDTALYHEVTPYWDGTRYYLHVRLESPYTDEPAFDEYLGYIVGRDQYILESLTEMVQSAIADVTGWKKRAR